MIFVIFDEWGRSVSYHDSEEDVRKEIEFVRDTQEIKSLIVSAYDDEGKKTVCLASEF